MARSTVRKKRKIERWEAPLFEKAEKSNGGSFHCSKKGEIRTQPNSFVRKSQKFAHNFALPFEKEKFYPNPISQNHYFLIFLKFIEKQYNYIEKRYIQS